MLLTHSFIATPYHDETIFKQLASWGFNPTYPSAIDEHSKRIYVLIDTESKTYWLVDEKTLKFSRSLVKEVFGTKIKTMTAREFYSKSQKLRTAKAI